MTVELEQLEYEGDLIVDYRDVSGSVRLERQSSLFEFIQVQKEAEEHREVDFLVQKFFEYGVCVAKRPKLFMFLCVLVVLICAPGLLLMEEETNLPPLFLNRNMEVYNHWKFLKDSFLASTDENWAVFYFKADDESINLLEPQYLREIVADFSLLLNAEGVHKGEPVGLDDVCYPYAPGKCSEPLSIFRIWGYDPDAIPSDLDTILRDLNRDPIQTHNNDTYYWEGQLWGTDFNGPNNQLLAGCSGIVGSVQYDPNKGIPIQVDYENAQIDLLNTMPKKPGYKILVASYAMFLVELENMNRALFLIVIISGAIVGAYTMWVLGGTNYVYGRKTMIFGCITSVMFAVICAFGISSYLGEKWSPTMFVPFILLLGLGLDDCFVLCWDYHQQYLWALHLQDIDHSNGGKKTLEELFPIHERVGRMMSNGGFSIFITSFTDFIVFFIGYFLSAIPVVKTFCLVCAIGIMFDFAFQITFFVGCLTIDAHRQDANKMDCLCCYTAEDPRANLFSSKKTDPFQSSVAQRLLGRWLPKLILRAPIIALTLFMGLFVFCIVGMMNMSPNWDITGLYEDGGVMQETISDMISEPNAFMPAQLVITPDSYTESTEWMTLLLLEMEAHPRVQNLVGWYPLYVLQLEPDIDSCRTIDDIITGDCYRANFPANDTQLALDVDHFLDTSPNGKFFKGDVVFEDDMSGIRTSRLMFQLKGTWDYEDVIDGYEEVAAIVERYDTYNMDTFIFNIHSAYFISNSSILWQTLIALAIGCPVICFIVWCILRHFQATLYVFMMMVLTDVDMIGLCYWLDIEFDFWFGLCVLVALGITVDFNIHITHRALHLIPDYEIEDQWQRNVEHTRAVLYTVGGSVFHGTFSTLLCVLPAIFLAPMTQVRSLNFKLFLILSTGMMNGLIVLPCLITIFPITRDETKEAGKERVFRIHRRASRNIEPDIELLMASSPQVSAITAFDVKSFSTDRFQMTQRGSINITPIETGGAVVDLETPQTVHIKRDVVRVSPIE